MTDNATKHDPSLELWRMPRVIEKTGLSKTAINDMIRAGTFPKARQISAQAVAWRSIEVLTWMDARPVVGEMKE
jgi:predicted DNA-binding transcriptional regulator AlpA